MDSATASATPAPVALKISPQKAIVWVLFLFSGICGLIYEVLWCQDLGLIFGNTVQSMSAVLTAFMGGLALGSYIGGRVCHLLKRPMMVYGILELSIGIYCMMLPWAFSVDSPIVPFYRHLYGETGGGTGLAVARFTISFFLLLIPTTFMGATLPVLSQYLVRSKAFFGKTVGALYAVNTFGAVLGAALTGFILLPALGKIGSNNFAVATNIILGALAVIFGMNQSAPVQRNDDSDDADDDDRNRAENSGSSGSGQAPISPPALRVAIFTFGLTGFAALATQIGWTRAITLATGSSRYAFSLIVAVFIFGLSIGGMWGSRMAGTSRDPLALLGKVLVAVGLGCMALTAILELGPALFFFLTVWGSDKGWNWQLTFQALGIGLLIIGPTFLMGATLPLTMQVAARTDGAPGKTVGTIYAVNTIGSILGSFMGGIVLLPRLQIRGTLQAMALLYAIPGLTLFFMSRSGRERKPLFDFVIVIAATAITIAVLLFSHAWNPATMSSGMYLLRLESRKAAQNGEWMKALSLADFNTGGKILYYNEGSAATVAVTDTGGKLALSVGGKPDASSHGDMSTQLGLTLMPEILHAKGPENVLVIGLGSGASAAAALAPDSVKSVDVVEMSPEVVEASYFFAPYTHLVYKEQPERKGFYWLDTPKLNLIVNDGRNHLLLTNKTYDVIASEPSNPWLAGVGSLFTKESFQLSRGRLNKGGIMCQWIHCYSLEESDFFNIVKTFGDVFPHMQLWCVNRLDFLLIGSEEPIRLPIAVLHEHLIQKNVLPWLQLIHFDSEEEFLACFQSTEEELRDRTAHFQSCENTDDNMMLEFSAPKALYHTNQMMQSTQFEADPEYVADLSALPPGERAAVEARVDFSASAREHIRCAFEGAGDAMEHKIIASILSPNQLWVVEDRKKIDAAIAKKAEEAPAQNRDAFIHVRQLSASGDVEKAMAELQKISLELTAAGKPALVCVETAVEILREHGRLNDALATADNVLRNTALEDPKSAPLWALKARIAQEKSEPKLALDSALHSEDLASKAGDPSGIVGWVLLKQNQFGPAFDEYLNANAVNPKRTELKLGLADALMGIATEPAPAKPSLALATRRLHHARRAAREAAKLMQDDPAAWARFARANVLLSAADAGSAAYHKQEAIKAWEKTGPLSGITAGITDTAALVKAGLSAKIPAIEAKFKMSADDYLQLVAMMAALK